MSIWFGPAGSLREFEPEAASPPEPVDGVVGGTHVGLSGARTVDLLGLRKTWSLAWKDLTIEEFAWLLAGFRRELGPLYVVDLRSPNLLPPSLRLWSPVDGGDAAQVADPFSRPAGSLDIGWALPAGTHRSGVVPLIRDVTGAVPPYAATVAVSGVGTRFRLRAVGADGRTMLTATPDRVVSDGSAQQLSLTLADFAGGLPVNAAFVCVELQVPAGTARAWQAQVAIGSQPYVPRGGSARVLVDSWSPRQVDPPSYAVSIKLEVL